MKPILISGGGIAGLALAISLCKRNIDVQVYEKVSHLSGIGAGLMLGPNAWKAIDHLGIRSIIEPHVNPLQSFTIKRADGRQISAQSDNLLSQLSGGEYTRSIHRAALHQALIAALPAAVLHTGAAVTGYRDHEEGVTMQLLDGTEVEGSGLIAADGIHSHLRAATGESRNPRYSGYTCWRGITPYKLLQPEGSETWGKNGRFGIVPLTHEQVYWYATVNAPQQDSRIRSWNRQQLSDNFKTYHGPIPDLLKNTPESSILQNDIDDLQPATRLAYGKVLLIGDAGHATTPNLGQGAALALEDAAWLSQRLLSNQPDLCFKQFEQARLKRINWIVSQSRKIGEIGQWEHPIAVGLRNTLMTLAPSKMNNKMLKRIYSIEF